VKIVTSYSHILINGMARTGGGLLNSLFDGHSELLVLPFEMLYSTNKVTYPRLKKASKTKDLILFQNEMNLESILKNYSKKKTISKDFYGKRKNEFNYSEFLKTLKEILNSHNQWVPSLLLNSVYRSFFLNWRNNYSKEKINSAQYVVNHCSMMCFADPIEFWNLFPNGYIIQTIRDPRSWYASRKNILETKNDDPIVLPQSILMWCESAIRAKINSSLYNNKYFTVRYEDIVLTPKKIMRKLSSIMNIEFQETMSVPTLDGAEWLGNSSFEPKTGIDRNHLDRWKKILTKYEIEYINEQCKDFIYLFKYEDKEKYKGDILEKFIGIPELKMNYKINVDSEDERLREECKRMSIFAHHLYSEIAMKKLNRRYTKKNRTMTTLVNKLMFK
jgi:Sulfotransferase family